MTIDELIIKCLKGELNLEEQHRLSKWLKKEDQNPEILKKIELFWRDPSHKFNDERKEVHQVILDKISDFHDKQIQLNPNQQKHPSSFRYVWIAATITLLAIMTFAISDNFKVEPEGVEQVFANESRRTLAGQKLQVHLRDGSQVKLNAESSIEFPKYFSDTARVISLKGEAYFEVADDQKRPFRVIVGDIFVQALGTSFSIKSEPGTTKVYLTSGRVSVSSYKIEEAVILAPGEMVVESNGFFDEVYTFDYSDIAWKDNILIFREALSSQVFHQLEKWYGVDIHVKDDLGKWSFSGRFENEPLKEVLLGISHSEEFDFEIRNKEVLITKKK